MTIQIHQGNDGYIVYKEPLKSNELQHLFAPDYLREQHYLTRIVQGRGQTFFFTPPTGEGLILRHYYRGGIAAKFFKDHYLYLGLQHTRAYRELVMLDQLYHQHLPVPKPFACKITLSRGFYTADIITHAISESETLAEKIQQAGIESKLWQKIGQTLSQFHRLGIHHHDLNANNILLTTQGDVFLIDFDKARYKNKGQQGWKQQNINRLLRSLNKIHRQTKLHFNLNDWAHLLEGYKA